MQMTSSTLMEAQKKLNQEGFDAGRVDGRWGPKTAEAVRSFQAKNNLPATARLDEQTLADLGVGASSATGSVSKKQSSEPSEASSMNSGGRQNMMQRHSDMMQGHYMECSHYMSMNVDGQTATVNSMRSKMAAANEMASSHEMAKKVAASCKDHPGMMVHEAMENVMPH
jgi:peptidoglycan hydrolase-like protein with peptidoglycan-binding domain